MAVTPNIRGESQSVALSQRAKPWRDGSRRGTAACRPCQFRAARRRGERPHKVEHAAACPRLVLISVPFLSFRFSPKFFPRKPNPIAMSTTTFDNFLASALELPPEQRSSLATRLIESLDEGSPVSEVWRETIRRRAAEIDDGSVQLLDHEEVMHQAREALAATTSRP